MIAFKLMFLDALSVRDVPENDGSYPAAAFPKSLS